MITKCFPKLSVRNSNCNLMAATGVRREQFGPRNQPLHGVAIMRLHGLLKYKPLKAPQNSVTLNSNQQLSLKLK